MAIRKLFRDQDKAARLNMIRDQRLVRSQEGELCLLIKALPDKTQSFSPLALDGMKVVLSVECGSGIVEVEGALRFKREQGPYGLWFPYGLVLQDPAQLSLIVMGLVMSNVTGFTFMVGEAREWRQNDFFRQAA